ncbi:hypothetical protein [Chitinophaga sp. LS1]|uniref:hypothetical protein n=1 Tax=Chitinophaga sp. LS1 TaxID=3051176 RepID=UPI002AAB59E4|nr:hypothetical protein [Chitinophaga sp. LS1]WPV65554.1 hypothetical protein QQL36_27515 [Chitinophaga sp. LS1]
MKALQLFGIIIISAIACNNPVKTSDQMADEKQQGTPGSEDIATQAQQFKTAEGLRSSGVMVKGNYKFVVKVSGDGSGRSLMISSQDLRGDTTKPAPDSTVIYDVKGKVTNMDVSDLDGDGNPEVFAFTKSDGTDAEGSVYGLTFIQHKAVRIFSGDVDKDSIPGYNGRDTFFIQQHYLVRKFPDGKQLKTIRYALKKDNQRYILKEAK